MRLTAKTRHRYDEVDGLRVHYREAGTPSATAVVLLHGVSGSSYGFRDVLPTLGEHHYAIAPDLPGAGLSDAPPLEEITFERLARIVEALLAARGVERWVLYVTDFGTPVGYHLATRHPDRVLGIVVQNGNVHEAGLHEPWDGPRRYWADPSDENLAALGDWMTADGVRNEYLGGIPEALRDRFAPESWEIDWTRLARPGAREAQFRLFTDYATHVARFDEIAAYHAEHQPPCLVLWGRHDPFFGIDEVLAFHARLATLDVHLFDGGHALLETHAPEVADLVTTFATDALDRAGLPA